jgi:hypothetical protein
LRLKQAMEEYEKTNSYFRITQFRLTTLLIAMFTFALGYWTASNASWFRPPLYKAHLDHMLASGEYGRNAPATSKEIRDLQLEVVNRPDLKLVLPPEYLRFLRFANGHQYDNFGIESTKTFVECNERWKTSGTPKHFVIFGGDETYLFVLDQISGQFHFLSWEVNETRATFASFDEMVAELLRKYS